MEWKDWLIPSAPGYITGDVTRRQRIALLQIVAESKVIAVERVDSASPGERSEMFRLLIQQPLKPSDSLNYQTTYQYSSLGIFFKKIDCSPDVEKVSVGCCLQMELALGAFANRGPKDFMKGFTESEKINLSKIIENSIVGLWFDGENNRPILCFEDKGNKSLFSIVFDGEIIKKGKFVSLKWLYVDENSI